MTKKNPLKIKEIDVHEAQLISTATAFVVNDYSKPKPEKTVLTGGLEEARKLVESPEKNSLLVYGYDKAFAERGGLPISVLLTKRNLQVYDILKSEGKL